MCLSLILIKFFFSLAQFSSRFYDEDYQYANYEISDISDSDFIYADIFYEGIFYEDFISILEDSFVTYIESPKAKGFLRKANGIAYLNGTFFLSNY